MMAARRTHNYRLHLLWAANSKKTCRGGTVLPVHKDDRVWSAATTTHRVLRFYTPSGGRAWADVLKIDRNNQVQLRKRNERERSVR